MPSFFQKLFGRNIEEVSASEPSVPEGAAQTSAGTDDGALLAAITAAVAAYLDLEAEAAGNTPTSFRVVSFRRVRTGAWNHL